MDKFSCVPKPVRLCLSAASGLLVAAFCFEVPPAGATVVSDWNEVALAEVRSSNQGPPVAARALAIVHTCIYDAWAAYDSVAIGTELGHSLRRPVAERTDRNKAAAISQAAYRCLLDLYPGAGKRLKSALTSLDHDPDQIPENVVAAVEAGNLAANAVIAARRNDGANQNGDLAPGAYKDYTGYAPRNLPLPYCMPQMETCAPLVIDDPLHWQPLVAENGTVQQFISPHWERVRPFALASAGQFDLLPWMAPPDIQRPGSLAYEKNVDELLQFTRELNEAKKLIVEYWADGPHSELPPGHWGLFAQFVSQRDHHDIDQDAKMFFAMHNASFDAGIVGWHLKRKYDGVRPITAIRLLKKGSIVLGWGGPGRPVEPIPAEKWTPYNPGSNLTPSFPGFVSGHSIFSRASATVLTLFTGSDHLGYTTIIAPGFGRVEPGVPLIPTTLRFATFSDAADEAGLSRFYAGIHFTDDNTIGQRLGELIGNIAFRKAQDYFRGVAALSAGN